MERRRVTFLGRVQGVCFRATAREIARRHPMTGWVRNEPDGSVLLEAQASPDTIDAFLAELRRAMAGNIRNENTIEIPIRSDEQSFEITY
jgi:acylphosphatase